MNPNLDPIEPPNTSASGLPAPEHQPPLPSEQDSQGVSPLFASAHNRAVGKIARLPKFIRDQINQWILDGFSYPDIIERLGEHGKDLKPDNLSQWKKRGHQDWLLEQSWLAQTRSRQEPASGLSIDFDATQLNHAALQLGALHMFEALRDLSSPPSPNNQPDTSGQSRDHRLPSLFDLKLGGDSAAFVRLINALARASRETMLIQKYREACAKARSALQEMKDPHRKLTESETRAIVRKVDEILGLGTTTKDPGFTGAIQDNRRDGDHGPVTKAPDLDPTGAHGENGENAGTSAFIL